MEQYERIYEIPVGKVVIPPGRIRQELGDMEGAE